MNALFPDLSFRRAYTGAELIVDSFAGGGGASTGIEMAVGYAPDIAINHDPEAIAMHTVNHPTSRHFCQNVWQIDPLEVCAGRPVGLAWFSPDCKHFSKAKGSKPVERNIRELLALPENHDIVVTGDARFNPTDVSVAAQIQRIKGAGPQAMIAWTTGSPIGTVFKAISDAGLDIPVATTDGNMTYAQMDQYAAFLPKTLYIPASQWMGPAAGRTLPPEMASAQAAFFDGVLDNALHCPHSDEPTAHGLHEVAALGVSRVAEKLLLRPEGHALQQVVVPVPLRVLRGVVLREA